MENEHKYIPKQEQSEAENIVSDPETGMSYRETIFNLPEHRAKETGITRIRRREVLTVPEAGIVRDESGEIRYYRTWKNIDYENEPLPFYKKLTDGKYPNPRLWNHTVNVNTESTKEKLEEHIREGIYLQKIYIGDKSSITTRLEKDKTGYFALPNVPGDTTWANRVDTPIYFFGNQNPNLVEYLKSILASPIALEMLKKDGWIDEPLDPNLISPSDPTYGEGKYHPKVYKDFRQNPKKAKIIEQFKTDNVHFYKDGQSQDETDEVIYNIDTLRKFIAGVPIWIRDVHRKIPIVQHPDIKPLRWCHAEMAIVPTKKGLNVLFFETEDSKP